MQDVEDCVRSRVSWSAQYMMPDDIRWVGVGNVSRAHPQFFPSFFAYSDPSSYLSDAGAASVTANPAARP